MAGTNSEKPSGKSEQKKQMVKNIPQKKIKVDKIPMKEKTEKSEKIKEIKKSEEEKNGKGTKKTEQKKPKKTKSFVRAENLPISTKVATSICKYLLNKKISEAISGLEEVSKLKKAIPMKGEYAHRKGKIMSGKFPVKASKRFIILLKSLQANAIQDDLENPIISEAISNKGSTVYASRGRRKKRTHVKIFCMEKKAKKKEKLKE